MTPGWNENSRPPRVMHTPLHPARASTPGEVIYLELWREWATARPREWWAIFETRGPVRQRAASVAASFMVFMGCNCGRGFTHRAEDFATNGIFMSRENAFLSAWAIENRRCRGINSGLRASEYMLAREYPIQARHGASRISEALIPAITMEDNDILESMVVWWSTTPAMVMRDIAVPMIEAANRKLRSHIFDPQED